MPYCVVCFLFNIKETGPSTIHNLPPLFFKTQTTINPKTNQTGPKSGMEKALKAAERQAQASLSKQQLKRTLAAVRKARVGLVCFVLVGLSVG